MMPWPARWRHRTQFITAARPRVHHYGVYYLTVELIGLPRPFFLFIPGCRGGVISPMASSRPSRLLAGGLGEVEELGDLLHHLLVRRGRAVFQPDGRQYWQPERNAVRTVEEGGRHAKGTRMWFKSTQRTQSARGIGARRRAVAGRLADRDARECPAAASR